MRILTTYVLLALACLALASNHFSVGGEPVSQSEENLLKLQVERAKAAALYGDNHPRVKQLDQETAMIRRLLAKPDTSEILVPLMVERQKAAAEFGEQHPWVMKIDRQIELAKKLLTETNVQERLVPLKAKRADTAAELGEKHPRVIDLDLEIKVTEKFLAASGTAKPDSDAVNADQIFATLQRLTQRIAALEQEVAELKANRNQ